MGLVILYVLICWQVSIAYGFEDSFQPIFYLNTGLIMSFGLASIYGLCLAIRAYYVMIFLRPPELSKHLMQELKNGPLKIERYARALPLFIGTMLFLSTFSCMKQIIPGIQPFAWDETFINLDKALHLGADPWRILQPLLGFPVITWAINIIYNLWLLILFGVLYWQAFSLKNLKVRMQFFFSFILCWAINGTLLAITLSSVGPCFYERLTGDDYFSPLMNYLRTANETYNLFAISTQDKVWESISNKETMIGGGVSAMPSIHVTSALLFLLTSLKLKTKIWPAFAVFFVLILAGSVHLGWHYAVDGYLAIVTTLIIWTLVGQVSNWARQSSNP